MQSSVEAFFQLKIKRKQRFQVRRQFQHFEYDMNRTLEEGFFKFLWPSQKIGTLFCTGVAKSWKFFRHLIVILLVKKPLVVLVF